MKRIIYIATALMTILLSGCNQFLGIKPKGFLIPETVKEYESILNDAGFMKVADTYPIYLTDDAYIPDADASGGYFIGYQTATQLIKNLYSFAPEVFGPSDQDTFWGESYSRIYSYNVIINHIMDAKEGTLEEKQSIKAEALVGRALEYLYLVNGYAVHYDPATAAKDLAVPIILDEDVNKDNLVRATVKEVYDLILADLTEANKMLPMRPKHNAFRASKSAGLGILARAYLYMGAYDKALQCAQASLEVNDALLDLKQYEVTNPYGAIGRTNVPRNISNPENIYIRFAPYVFGVSSQVHGSDDLMALFTPEDARVTLYFTSEPYGIPVDHPLWLQYLDANLAIATPEIYLTAAECEARIGSKDKAIEYINKLRDHRITDNTPLVAQSNEEALNIVLQERRRELAFQGPLRLYDLKRLNKDPKFAKTITRTIEGKTYSLKPNSPIYVLPIPQEVLRFNPQMPDNIRQ